MNLIETQKTLRAIVRPFIPKNSRTYRFLTFDGTPQESMLGIKVDPKPFEGKVIHIDDEAIYLKTGRTQFAIVSKALATVIPSLDDKILVSPYARHNFAGVRVDEPEIDGYFKVTHLGGKDISLPVEKPQCQELADLINYIEKLPAPDNFRNIVNMLVDAKATNFATIDPTAALIIETPPTLSFTVSTEKFSGHVSIIFMRGSDTFSIELKDKHSQTDRRDHVFFDELGHVLCDLIDDGKWRNIRVEILSKSKVKSKKLESVS